MISGFSDWSLSVLGCGSGEEISDLISHGGHAHIYAQACGVSGILGFGGSFSNIAAGFIECLEARLGKFIDVAIVGFASDEPFNHGVGVSFKFNDVPNTGLA